MKKNLELNFWEIIPWRVYQPSRGLTSVRRSATGKITEPIFFPWVKVLSLCMLIDNYRTKYQSVQETIVNQVLQKPHQCCPTNEDGRFCSTWGHQHHPLLWWPRLQSSVLASTTKGEIWASYNKSSQNYRFLVVRQYIPQHKPMACQKGQGERGLWLLRQ